MSSVNDNLVGWIRKQVADLTEDGVIDRFELWHVVDGESGERCQTISRPDGEDENFDVELLAQGIWDIAEHDSGTRTTGVPQRYVVWAFRAGAGDEPCSTHPFILRGRGASPFMMGGDTEPPTEKGQIAAHLRHSENQHRMIMHFAESLSGRLSKELDSERQLRVTLQDKVVESYSVFQDLLDRKADRETEQARELSKARRHDEMMGMLMAFVPLIMAKLAGGKDGIGQILPKQGLRDHAIGKFMRELSQEEFMGILKSVSPAKQAALLEVYKSYREDDQKEELKKPAVFRSNQDDGTPVKEEDSDEAAH